MNSSASPTSCNEALLWRYEQLRGQVVTSPPGAARGAGLALLMHSGMRAWMQAWAQCTVAAPAPAQQAPGEAQVFPLETHEEVAMILAGMVLHGRGEVRAC